MIKFTKMHGIGNDFIIIDNMLEQEMPYWEMALNLCRRNFSIGADGILIALPSDKADFRMRVFNNDGTEARMCGNGIRCLAGYLYENKFTSNKTMTIETKGGIKTPEIISSGKGEINVRVDMGIPCFDPEKIPIDIKGKDRILNESITAQGRDFTISAVSMGNPHCVIFVDKVTRDMVLQWGPILEKHPLFFHRTNVEFASVQNPNKVEIKVWERGAGETLACGTGACAVTAVGSALGLLENKVEAVLPGGTLHIEIDNSGKIFMTGPAVKVFKGEVDFNL